MFGGAWKLRGVTILERSVVELGAYLVPVLKEAEFLDGANHGSGEETQTNQRKSANDQTEQHQREIVNDLPDLGVQKQKR